MQCVVQRFSGRHAVCCQSAVLCSGGAVLSCVMQCRVPSFVVACCTICRCGLLLCVGVRVWVHSHPRHTALHQSNAVQSTKSHRATLHKHRTTPQ